MKPALILRLIALTFLLSVLNSCSSVKEVQSYLDNHNVVIDGLKNDWEGKLIFDSKSKIAVGFQNDPENLYLCITTNDRSNIMKIMRLGLTVWLEPDGKGKKIGVKYPLVDLERMRDMPFRTETPDFEKENPDDRFKKFISVQNELSIVNEDNYPLYLINNNDEKNIQAKIEMTGGTFAYELKVPLSTNKQAKYFVESTPAEKIKIGIETNVFKMETPSNRMSGINNPNGGRQPGAGQGKHSQGMQGDRNFEMNNDPVKLWYVVTLIK